MEKQPEALRLADELDQGDFDVLTNYDAAAELRRLHAVEGLYNELLYAVGSKHAGETRHQTALRYIQRAEVSDDHTARRNI